jgi:hypothetical protein
MRSGWLARIAFCFEPSPITHQKNPLNATTRSILMLRRLFAYTQAKAGPTKVNAIQRPEKMNLGFVFQNIHHPSTTGMRVPSGSRWPNFLTEKTKKI